MINRSSVRASGLSVLVLASITIGCSKSPASSLTGRTGAGAGRGSRAAVAIDATTKVERIKVQRRVDLSGTLLSPDQARVSSEVAGVVREVPVQLGSDVKLGDPLVRLEPRELQLAVDRAE